MAKDKAYGAAIFVVSIILILGYFYWAIIIPIFEPIAELPLGDTLLANLYWATEIPVWIAVTAILAIAAWIGYTMMTTPPPIPIEELEEEMELEESSEQTA
ncbi:MAG: hypothetical protein ACTSSJ_03800 [Candidatus Odinarchaeia archaeon]